MCTKRSRRARTCVLWSAYRRLARRPEDDRALEGPLRRPRRAVPTLPAQHELASALEDPAVLARQAQAEGVVATRREPVVLAVDAQQPLVVQDQVAGHVGHRGLDRSFDGEAALAALHAHA